MANIFLDETTPAFKLGPVTLADPSLQSSAFIGGTALPVEGGTFSLTFQGTSAGFYGEIGAANLSTTVAELTNLVIDRQAPSTVTIPEQGSEGLFYETPTLASGSHNISFFTFSNLNFDYFVIAAANDTDLSGQTLIVDDSDPSIVYSGNWTKNSTVLQSATNSRTPYGNSTQQTNVEGASATFSFSGSSVSVYGVINEDPISISFIMDGIPVPTTPFAGSNGNLNPTFLWFSSDSLAPADHTLQMKVTQTSGAFFTLDYILYKPSFASLASKPAPTSSIATSSRSTATNTASPGPSSPPNGSGNTGPNSKPSAAVIAGSIIGCVAFIILIGLAFWFWRKRVSRRRGRQMSIDLEDESDAVPDPFPPPTYRENRANKSSDLLMQISNPANRVTNDSENEENISPTAQSSSSLLRVNPFYLSTEHQGQISNTSLPRTKPGLSRPTASPPHPPLPHERNSRDHLEGNGNSGPSAAAENPRVQELVTQLQRELASSGSEGRDVLLRGLLNQGGAIESGEETADRPNERWNIRQSMAPSTLPPPYELDTDVRRSGTLDIAHPRARTKS